MKTLEEFLHKDVSKVKDRTTKWLSEMFFFRDPSRASRQNYERFNSPADGVILYSKVVKPDESIVEIKGVNYTLKDAMGDSFFNKECLVIGIFMTFYSVHINRIPYSGILSYEKLPPIKSFNRPMIGIEKGLLQELRIKENNLDYLFSNERMINTIHSNKLGQDIFVLQIADYDVNTITPFILDQGTIVKQGQKFSAIRYGSQTDLIIPLSDKFEFESLVEPTLVVEGGEPIVKIKRKSICI